MANKQVKKLLDQIERAYEAGEHETAIQLCEQLLKIDPESVDARLCLADLALEEGDAHRVIELAYEILEREEENVDALLLLADGNFLEGDFESSIEACDAALELDPENLQARFTMAESLLELGAAREAAELYESIVEEEPEHLASLLGLGVAQFESCQFNSAFATLEDLLELDPGNADAHFFRGLILERQGERAQADAELARARELDPETYPEPVDLSVDELEAVVEDVLRQMPDKLRTYLKNVPIVLEDLPSDALLTSSEPPHSPNLWGMFVGQSLAEQQSVGDPWAHLPSQILLFRTNLQRSVRSREELLEEIRVTLIHEVLHFLGLDENEVAERGWQ